MSFTVTALYGSSRKGSTYYITHAFVEELERLLQGKVQFTEVFAADCGIPFCRSCNACFIKGENSCPHKDTVLPVAEALMKSDLILLASPVYSLQLSAALKNVIDHLSWFFHRPPLYPKKAVIIASTIGAAEKKVARYLSEVASFWGVNRSYAITVKTRDLNYRPDAKLLRVIRRIAERVHQDLVTAKVYPPSWYSVFFFNAWRAIHQAGTEESRYDYEHWKSKGWLDRLYYNQEKLSLPKKLLGSSIYRLLKTVVARSAGKKKRHVSTLKTGTPE